MELAIAGVIGVFLGIGLTVSTISAVLGNVAEAFLDAPLSFIFRNILS